jgi:hypothetical protein
MRERGCRADITRSFRGVCVFGFFGFFFGWLLRGFPKDQLSGDHEVRRILLQGKGYYLQLKVIGGGSVRKSGRYARRIQLHGLASSKQASKKTDGPCSSSSSNRVIRMITYLERSCEESVVAKMGPARV